MKTLGASELTLRDLYAAAALAGLSAGCGDLSDRKMSALATQAFAMAGVMLVERETDRAGAADEFAVAKQRILDLEEKLRAMTMVAEDAKGMAKTALRREAKLREALEIIWNTYGLDPSILADLATDDRRGDMNHSDQQS